ncbi:MAG: NAD(P)-dependent oxidoreductase [Actinomycetota bacterium]
MRRGLPVQLAVEGWRCVVVGAGAAGRRKVLALLDAGAHVRVVDPAGFPTVGLAADATERVEVLQRRWAPGDTADARMVVAATDDEAVNQAVAAEAEVARALVLRADQADKGDLWSPAVLRRPPVTVAIDSGGTSAGLSIVLRDEIASLLDHEAERWEELAAWAAEHHPVSSSEVAARLAEMRAAR